MGRQSSTVMEASASHMLLEGTEVVLLTGSSISSKAAPLPLGPLIQPLPVLLLGAAL